MLAKQILNKIETKPQDLQSEGTEVVPKEPSRKPCNCKRTKCLKLYCECFANNRFCGPECACCGCSNDDDHGEERLLAKEQILMRNPLAFRPKIETSLDEESFFKKDIKINDVDLQTNSEVLLNVPTKSKQFGVLAVQDSEKRHFKGCNCKKSNCQKKYCECYQQGVMCSDLCKCDGCKNTEELRPSTFENLFKVQKVAREEQKAPFGEITSALNTTQQNNS